MPDSLGPPPAPKPATMPPMTEEDKKKLGMASPAPVQMMPMMMSCPPPSMHTTNPTMGPNLVFNFYQSPYGMGVPMHPNPVAEKPKEEKKKEEKKEEAKKKEPEKKKAVLVQGDPTWNDPRMLAPKGKPIKGNDCLIQ